jgi:hypothetical protein
MEEEKNSIEFEEEQPKNPINVSGRAPLNRPSRPVVPARVPWDQYLKEHANEQAVDFDWSSAPNPQDDTIPGITLPIYVGLPGTSAKTLSA